MTKQLLQRALAALEDADQLVTLDAVEQTIEALRAAIAAPQPEPVGYISQHERMNDGKRVIGFEPEDGCNNKPVYLAPPDTEALRKELDDARKMIAGLEAANGGPYFGHYQQALGKLSVLVHQLADRERELERVKGERDSTKHSLSLSLQRIGFLEATANARWEPKP